MTQVQIAPEVTRALKIESNKDKVRSAGVSFSHDVSIPSERMQGVNADTSAKQKGESNPDSDTQSLKLKDLDSNGQAIEMNDNEGAP